MVFTLKKQATIKLIGTLSISEAEGYALERVNRAQGEATRFEAILGQYEQAPQVTRRRLYLEAMTGFLSDMKGLYIVDKGDWPSQPEICEEVCVDHLEQTI